MRLLVELEEDGPVTPEIVRGRVERAIEMMRDNEGLSGDEDEGQINTVEVTILPEEA